MSVRKDVQVVPDLYAQFIGLPDDTNLEAFLLNYFISKIIPKINYPIILTDSLRTPFSWENLEIEKIKFENLPERDQAKLTKMVKRFEGKKNVIPLEFEQDGKKSVNYLFYGESETVRQILLMPYIEVVMVILFVLLGIYGIFSLKKNEENKLWVGLAKETAHQFGTPISSLMGWLDILSMKMEQSGGDEEMISMLNYMRTDVNRLHKTASRFGKVGSSIKKMDTNLFHVLQEITDYFQSRLPSLGAEITLTCECEKELPLVKIDQDLIKWTMENLIKNSIDALKEKSGEITIKAFSKNNKVYIQVKDNGVGMQKSMFKTIFYPGITSKQRGWGLGLSLAKRIVEEFHHGKIHVLESEVGKGTTFEIILKED
jgi:HSP90 family molecular chaperone